MSNQEQHKHVISSLHKLIALNKDSDRGYKEASENIKDPELKTILYRLSQQRAEFRGDIEEILRKDYRDNAEPSDTILSKLHRGWMDFKSSISGNDNEAVLKECITGEKHAIDTYTDALSGHLPEYIEEKLKSQLDLIKGALSQVKEFSASVHHS